MRPFAPEVPRVRPLSIQPRHKKRAEAQIAKVNIPAILNNTAALGTQLRWARTEARTLYDEGHREEHQLLLVHIEAAEVATQLVDRKSRDMKPDEYRSKVKALQDFGVEWPVALQGQFFDKYLDEQLTSFGGQGLGAFMRSVLPWTPTNEEAMDGEPDEAFRDGVGLPFDALAPKLAYMRLDASEKASRFRARMFIGIERGQESVDEFIKAIDFTMDFLEGNMSDNDVDAFDNAVDAYTKAAQAIKQLARPLNLMYRAELEEVMTSGKKKTKPPTDEDNALMTIAAAVNKSAFWRALYSDFTANKNKLAEHLPAIANAMECIANAPSPFERLAFVSPALAALARLETDIGEDLASSFRADLMKLAMESVQAAERSLSAQGLEAATLAKRLENGVVLARAEVSQHEGGSLHGGHRAIAGALGGLPLAVRRRPGRPGQQALRVPGRRRHRARQSDGRRRIGEGHPQRALVRRGVVRLVAHDSHEEGVHFSLQ